MQAFFYMGGYGFYIWTAVGISSVVLLTILFVAIKKQRQVWQAIAQQQGSDHAAKA